MKGKSYEPAVTNLSLLFTFDFQANCKRANMSKQDNTNNGVLFVNKRKTEPKHPNLTGHLNIDGEEHWFEGWSDGTGKPGERMRLRFYPKDHEHKADAGAGEMKRVDKSGKKETYPDWKGEITLHGGEHMSCAGWRRKNSKDGSILLSVIIERSERKPEQKQQQPKQDDFVF